MKKDFLGKRFLVIAAHPDDESFVAAGTMHENYKRGGENFVICASAGEKGKSHIKYRMSVSRLKAIRKNELLSASKFLHVSRVYFLGMPDGALRSRKSDLYKKCLPIAKKTKPDFILSFGPDGISGHTDHIAVGGAAKKIAQKLHVPFAAFALSAKLLKDAHLWLLKRRKHGHYKHTIKFSKPNLSIGIDAEQKKRALRCHKSQMEGKNIFAGFPAYAVRELLRSEHFFLESR